MSTQLLLDLTKHIVCYSGGHSSALVAVEVCRRYGKENTILLNHDISSWVEDADVKRFKQEVSDYLKLPITYANYEGVESSLLPDQFDVCVAAAGFKFGVGTDQCTKFLKTKPFAEYLEKHFSDKNCIIYYGFDANEKVRIQRRSSILGQQGYKTDYPLALWTNRTIYSTDEIGIAPPMTYSSFKHANCVGCLKAGKQHWYIVYCTRPDIWAKAKWAEEEIGHSIIKGVYLEELEEDFKRMKQADVPQTERIVQQTFWKITREALNKQIDSDEDSKPCECVF
jgi:hypothetical protein